MLTNSFAFVKLAILVLEYEATCFGFAMGCGVLRARKVVLHLLAG